MSFHYQSLRCLRFGSNRSGPGWLSACGLWLLAAALVAVQAAPALAATITWKSTATGSQPWTTGTNWVDDLAPTVNDDVVFNGVDAAVTVTNIQSAQSLTVNQTGSGSISLQTVGQPTDRTYSSSLSLNQLGTGDINVGIGQGSQPRNLTVNGPMTVLGVGGFNSFGVQGLAGSTLKATSLTLGGINGAIQYPAFLMLLPGPTVTDIIDVPEVVFNQGSRTGMNNRFRGTVRFTGNVTLQPGDPSIYSGSSPEFGSRLDHSGATLQTGTIRVDGNLSQTNGFLRSEGDGTLRIDGNWLLAGTTSRVLNTVSTIANPRTGDFRLGGNFDISATSMQFSNEGLNGVRFALIGTTNQLLEAAVSSSNSTFRLGTLTLADSTFSLVDAHENVSGDEYFQTSTLANTGTSRLDLNGLRFFVGSTELLEGNTYTEFGGSVVVVPEPATAGLLGVAAAGLAVVLARRRRR